MSFLARLSLKNRSLIALATIAILLIGALVIPTLKQELFPSLDFPAVSVVTVDAGASPTIVEHDVTNPLEQSIQGIAGIQQMTSYSNQGVSIIVVEYNFGTDINQASQTLTQHINQAQASLPIGHHAPGPDLQRRLSAGYSTGRHLIGGSCHARRAGQTGGGACPARHRRGGQCQCHRRGAAGRDGDIGPKKGAGRRALGEPDRRRAAGQ